MSADPTAFPAGHFAGETASWHVSGTILSEVVHPSRKSVPAHRHEAAYFSLLLEGAYAERGDGFNLRYDPYTLVFHSAQTVHEDRMLERSRFFAVELLSEWHSVIAELGGAKAHVFELDGGDPVWLVLRLYREFLKRSQGSEASIEALLYELCAHVADRQTLEGREPAWLPDVDAIVRGSCVDSLDLKTLAAGLGVHPAHLCRTYRRFRGRTISDALLGMRVQRVCRRLIESDEPLASIAADLGFSDQSHMNNVFKRFTGYAPGAHRKYERAKLQELNR